MNNIAGQPVQPCLPNEIAVDLPYRDLVIDFLNGIEAGAAIPGESNKTLELGLITLQTESSTAAKIMDRWGERVPIRPRPGLAPPRLSTVERILDGIRIGIGEANGGWHPHVGKVREANIGGLPHIGSGWEYPESLRTSAEIETLLSARPGAGEPIVIGMIDSPVAPHPRLEDRWSDPAGTSSAWAVSTVYPWLRGHGTFVAGRILCRAPSSAHLKVYGVLGGDIPVSTVWEVAKAMAAAADAGIKVLNCSVGLYTADGEPPFIMERAVEVLAAKGVAVVAAAGNHGEGEGPYPKTAPIFPAACRGAIAVGAFEDAISCKPAPLSPLVPWVALGAPAIKVESTYLKGDVDFNQIDGLPPAPGRTEFFGYAKWSGTSFATATVSGEIARRVVENGGDVKQAVADLLATDPATNDGIGWYCKK